MALLARLAVLEVGVGLAARPLEGHLDVAGALRVWVVGLCGAWPLVSIVDRGLAARAATALADLVDARDEDDEEEDAHGDGDVPADGMHAGRAGW